MQYGLYQVGDGTGNYKPSSPSIPRENIIQTNIVKAIKKQYPNAVVWNMHGGGMQKAGIPDIYVGFNGASVWIEIKRHGADTTRLQRDKLKKLIATGVYAGTAESVETALEILSTIDAIEKDVTIL